MAYVHRGLEACAGRRGRRAVSAFIATAFAQDRCRRRQSSVAPLADHLRPKLLKFAAFLDEAETDDRHRLAQCGRAAAVRYSLALRWRLRYSETARAAAGCDDLAAHGSRATCVGKIRPNSKIRDAIVGIRDSAPG